MRGNHTQGITTGESVKKTKQAREVPQKWEWTEPSVWTERMLTTLEKGVKGGVWFSLIDKIFSKRNLYSSFRKTMDGWVRMRLRSILRKRRNGKGRGRGKDHNRWPNKFFAERGLFSLKTNLQYVRQSSRR